MGNLSILRINYTLLNWTLRMWIISLRYGDFSGRAARSVAFLNAGFGLAAPQRTSKATRPEKSPYLKAIIWHYYVQFDKVWFIL